MTIRNHASTSHPTSGALEVLVRVERVIIEANANTLTIAPPRSVYGSIVAKLHHGNDEYRIESQKD